MHVLRSGHAYWLAVLAAGLGTWILVAQTTSAPEDSGETVHPVAAMYAKENPELLAYHLNHWSDVVSRYQAGTTLAAFESGVGEHFRFRAEGPDVILGPGIFYVYYLVDDVTEIRVQVRHISQPKPVDVLLASPQARLRTVWLIGERGNLHLRP